MKRILPLAFSVLALVSLSNCDSEKKTQPQLEIRPPEAQRTCDTTRHTVAFGSPGTAGAIEVTDLSTIAFDRFDLSGVHYSRLSTTTGATPSTSLIEIAGPDAEHQVTDCYGSSDGSVSVVSGGYESTAFLFASIGTGTYVSPAVLRLSLEADGSKASLKFETLANDSAAFSEPAALFKSTGDWSNVKVFRNPNGSHEVQLIRTEKIGPFNEEIVLRLDFEMKG